MKKPAFIRTAIAAVLLALTAGCASLITAPANTEAAALRAGEYRLDPAHASLLFKVDHLGLSTYVGRFNSFEATLDFDETDPSAARLDVRVDVASLDVNDADFSATLTGPDWLNAAGHPQAQFTSTRIVVSGENTGVATGDLTLNGVTRPASLAITFRGGARNRLTGRYTLGFDGAMTLDRTAFGIDRFVGAVGTDVTLEFHGEFQRQ